MAFYRQIVAVWRVVAVREHKVVAACGFPKVPRPSQDASDWRAHDDPNNVLGFRAGYPVPCRPKNVLKLTPPFVFKNVE